MGYVDAAGIPPPGHQYVTLYALALSRPTAVAGARPPFVLCSPTHPLPSMIAGSAVVPPRSINGVVLLRCFALCPRRRDRMATHKSKLCEIQRCTGSIFCFIVSNFCCQCTRVLSERPSWKCLSPHWKLCHTASALHGLNPHPNPRWPTATLPPRLKLDHTTCYTFSENGVAVPN